MESWSTSWSNSASDRPDPRALRILPREFYARPTERVARELLGKVLAVRSRGGVRGVAARIVETEAYHGADPASHCSRGRTARCSVMFGEPGVAYVYFIYGNYEMLNFVTEPAGYPGAVLIRAAEPLAGLELMSRRRAGAKAADWTNGPGRLCRALGIRLSHNGKPLQGPALAVFDDGARVPDASVRVSPRIGITRGRDRYWRYFVKTSACVSRAPENRIARAYRSDATGREAG